VLRWFPAYRPAYTLLEPLIDLSHPLGIASLGSSLKLFASRRLTLSEYTGGNEQRTSATVVHVQVQPVRGSGRRDGIHAAIHSLSIASRVEAVSNSPAGRWTRRPTMPFNTFSVASAVTPSVIETYFSHYLNRSPLKNKPTAHVSYHEGLRLIRQFLEYSSRHAVEDLQAFTSQWVPAPTWVRTHNNEIAPQFLERAARIVQAQLGRKGLDRVGGPTWWQWRRPNGELKAEWIEMKKDFNERRRNGTKCERCIFYVHGGAYYFGSVDEHRYQMQRHARKLKARVLAPRYRLAPQFPFPCGLYDCIATYLYLLEHFKPEQIIFAGDSAGGGMVLSMLVTLRDQGLPLPAGSILLSPWVDLTHSFPSVAGDGAGDYIPPHGFHHKPSMAWPPPSSDEIRRPTKHFERPPADAIELPATAGLDMKARPKTVDEDSQDVKKASKPQQKNAQVPGLGENLSINLDGHVVEIKEQIQMYTTNDMLSHPLVSPVLQPSLGGLPPMLIQVGGAELLHDEQVYLAHKAANPKAYPPSEAVLDEYDRNREWLNRYPPTDVQLQVWEDLCHVPHTLSFTRPAKYMYRSVAQFGAWALAHAQHKGIDIQDDDAVSIISDGPETDGEDPDASTTDLRRRKTNTARNEHPPRPNTALSVGAVGRAGDPIPPFKEHMIRQRVTRHGVIYPLAPESEMASLALDPASIGAIKPGPVRKWLAKLRDTDAKFGNEKRKTQKKRAKELASGYDQIPGETPPPTALVGRRRKGVAPEEKKKGKSWGLAMWSGWGSSHDEQTLDREEKAQKESHRTHPIPGAVLHDESLASTTRLAQPQRQVPPPSAIASSSTLMVPEIVEADEGSKKKRRTSAASFMSWSRQRDQERPRSPYREVRDTGQTANENESPRLGTASVQGPYSRRSSTSTNVFASRPVSVAATAAPPTSGALAPESVQVPGSQNTFLDPTGSGRPHNGIVAYPFKLRNPTSNPSTTTLDSQGVSPAPAAPSIEMPTPADERSKAGPEEAWHDRSEPVSAFPTDQAGASTPPSTSHEPVSPIEGPSRTREDLFNRPSSLLGPTGPDGLPTAPLMARKAADLKNEDAAPVSPVDGSNKTPFKIRNPVFDRRADASGAVTPTGPNEAVTQARTITPVQQLAPGEATEATKAAPFKLRHTVVDPKVAPGGKPTEPPAMPTAAPPKPPSEQSMPSDTPPERPAPQADDYNMSIEHNSTEPLPPNAHVVMPTVVTRRPMANRQNTPPKPPPKDDLPGYRSGLKNGSKTSSKASSLDVKPSRTPSPIEQKVSEKGKSPKSKLGGHAPIIGELGFEKGGADEKKVLSEGERDMDFRRRAEA
jgi:acetyl esterase/lipase